jgi:hypothetical protein
MDELFLIFHPKKEEIYSIIKLINGILLTAIHLILSIKILNSN